MHIEDGEEPPEVCIAPPLSPALTRYVEAFHYLSSDRPVGMDVGAIPTSAILAFAREIDGVAGRRELLLYLRMVRAIDDEFLRARRASAEKEREKR
ncbi:phage tail assembly chaperone [Pararhodospirillum photometricum]|uniref:Uncharacterized protein n=1 Tax=Pararhodospirillum photometricum DSM 122 TaxID=1150469 RepID=H6SL10_PARPM|nr:hypothetical protein [Pararhodospirillum photometricum]CCG08675.1 unnamed protein product [Pararhodospirillum photometricum DSM 122]